MFLKTMKMMMRTLIWIQKKDTIDDKGKPMVVTKHLESMWVKTLFAVVSISGNATDDRGWKGVKVSRW